MAEEVPTCGIDTVSAAAEIYLVEIELENLFLGKLPFHGHRQNGLAKFAVERTIAVEEDIARELLGNGGGGAEPVLTRRPDIDGARQAIRVYAGMRIESPVLDGDHGVLHDLRDFARRDPFAVTGAKLDQLGSVARPNYDSLRILGRLELIITREGSRCECHCNGEENQPENGNTCSPQKRPAKPDLQPAGFAPPLFCRPPRSFGALAAFAAAASLIHSLRLPSCSRRAALYPPQSSMARRNLGLTNRGEAASHPLSRRVRIRARQS